MRKFSKDLDNLQKPHIKLALIDLIKSLEEADSLASIPHIKKLKGFSNAYRVRIGDYRVGFFLADNTIELARITHRKDIYSIFP